MRTVLRSGVVVAAAVATMVAGCSSDSGYGAKAGGDGTTVADGGTAAAGDGATIANYSFSSSGTLKAGTPFTVTNTDGVTHTFSEPGGAFDVKVPGGGTAQVTVATAGTYTVICKIHASMKGTITVV